MGMGNPYQKRIKRYRYIKLNKKDIEKIVEIFRESYTITDFNFNWDSHPFNRNEGEVEIPDRCSSIQFLGYNPDKNSGKSQLFLHLSSLQNYIELTYPNDEQERSAFEIIQGIVEKGIVKFNSEPIEKNFPPIILYKEDIDELLNIIIKETESSSITLGNLNFDLSDDEINSIEDLDFNLNKTLDRLVFSGSIAHDSENGYYAFGPKESIRIVLSKYEASITLSDRTNIKSLGILSAIEQVFRRQKRPILSLIATPTRSLLPIPTKSTILIPLIISILIFIGGIVNPMALFISFWVPFFFLYFMVEPFFPKTKIILTKKPESSFEYIRINKGRIVEGLIIAIIAAIAGALVSGLILNWI